MLTLIVVGEEFYDEGKQEFIFPDPTVLELEHSLVSLSKWESIHEKPFLGNDEKSEEELLSYLECMILTPNFPPEVLSQLSAKNLEDVNSYINRKMTATWFSDTKKSKRTPDVITNELVYYWLFSAGIDISCQNWHLNRLLTLIRVFSAKNEEIDPNRKKPNTAEMAQSRRELNAKRRAEMGTSG